MHRSTFLWLFLILTVAVAGCDSENPSPSNLLTLISTDEPPVATYIETFSVVATLSPLPTPVPTPTPAVPNLPLLLEASNSPGMRAWIDRPTYLPVYEANRVIFSVQFDSKKWDLELNQYGGAQLVHQNIANCQIRPDVGRGTYPDWTVEHKPKTLGEVLYSAAFANHQDNLQFILYCTSAIDVLTCFNVAPGDQCIVDAEEVLATFLAASILELPPAHEDK